MMRALAVLGVLILGTSANAQSADAPAGLSSNPQQPDPLPANPVLPGEEPGSALMPDVIPLLQVVEEALLPGELPLMAVPEDTPLELPRYRLQLAIDAMQPVLPALDFGRRAMSLPSGVKVHVKRFEFTGNRAFSDRRLAREVARYTGRVITSEELEEARVAVTRLYVEAGFITSGAVLPDQDPATGVIELQIIEGQLTEIALEGNWWFRPWYLRNQLRRAAGHPVNFNDLKVGLQLLRQSPTISRINAELKPGARSGESILHVTVKDEQPFRLGLEVSNRRPPSVGEGLGEITLSNLNLTGHNDPLELRWGLLRGTKDGSIDYAEFDTIGGSYTFPVTPWDTTLSVHASRSDSSIIDETFAALGITSASEEIGATLRQPLYQTLNNTVAVSVSGDRKHSETFLLGRPFTLSLGAIEGESDVFAMRFGAEWVNRSLLHVLALRTSFSVGLYTLDATEADATQTGAAGAGGAEGFDPEIPDGKFFAWLGQGQYVRRILDLPTWRKKPDSYGWNVLRETLLVARANVQLADEPLLALEQFSIGGVQSVRGYRENQLLRDNGIFASAELRIPLWMRKDRTPVVSLAPFFDWGTGWNVNKVEDSNETILSAGVGLLVNAGRHVQASLYWGHPFVQLQESDESLQDYGVHFSIAINAF